MISNTIDTIEFELTQCCQLHCPHCFVNKVNGNMTEKTFKNALQFILEVSKTTTSPKFGIVLTGGETSLFDLDILSKGIDWLRENIKLPLKIYFQTNLMYDITDKHMEVFKKINILNTSWDYKSRFESPQQEAKLFSNIRKLQEAGIYVHLIVSITDTLVHEVTPEMFMSFIMATRVKSFDFNRLFTPNGYTAEEYRKITKATAIEQADWYYKVYRIWEAVRNELGITVFDYECLEDSYKNIHYNQYSFTCPDTFIHITPLGLITYCHDIREHSFGNVNTGEFDEKKYKEILDQHHTVWEIPDCKDCKYAKYCQSRCQWMYHDETGCTVPKAAYDYLKEKEALEQGKK